MNDYLLSPSNLFLKKQFFPEYDITDKQCKFSRNKI